MAFPKVKLSDNSGNAVSVTSNRLDVNAYLSATPTIDIGDVSLLLGGTAASTNADTMDDQTLRVTLATDDTHWGTVGTAADVDGTAHAQLRYIGNSFASLIVNTGNTSTNTDYIVYGKHATGTTFDTSDIGFACAVVRNDTLANLDGNIASGDYTILQVNALGGLYVTGSEVENAAVQSQPLLIGGRYDSSARTLGNGDAGAIALNASGHVIMDVVDGGQLDALLDTIKVDTEAIETAVEILDNAISGSEMQVDVVASLPAGSAAIGKLAANSGVDIGDVDVTSTVHPAGNGTFNSYAQFTAATSPTALTDASNGVNGTETAAKEVVIQSDFDNTGYLMVGDSGAAADTNGIRLNAGDTLILPVANIANIYIDASAGSQTVNVTVIK